MGDMQRSIRFPDDLAERISAIADSEDRSFSYVVVRAMERALGDAEGDRIPERPAPPRSPSNPGTGVPRGFDPELDARYPKHAPKAHRRKRAESAMSAALARQQALNKSKGI